MVSREKRCTHCHGRGFVFKKDGVTKSDILKCGICSGSGELPEGYKKAKRKVVAKNTHINKYSGIELLSSVEAV